jgi:acyl dehydratase
MLDSLDKYLDEYVVGDRFVTRSRTVTETDLVIFAGLSGDYNPLHTDAVFAESTQFGQRIAHGTLVLALVTGPTMALSGSGKQNLALAGIDGIRFLKPVFIGDTIHVEGEIVGIIPKDENRGLLTRREDIINQRGEKVATYTKTAFVRRKKAE